MANFKELQDKPRRLADLPETVEHEKALMRQYQRFGLKKSKRELKEYLEQLKGDRYRRPLNDPTSPNLEDSSENDE